MCLSRPTSTISEAAQGGYRNHCCRSAIKLKGIEAVQTMAASTSSSNGCGALALSPGSYTAGQTRWLTGMRASVAADVRTMMNIEVLITRFGESEKLLLLRP